MLPQLAPWSTPQLRQRLLDVFGVPSDPETVDRDGVSSDTYNQCEEPLPSLVVSLLRSSPLCQLCRSVVMPHFT